MKSNPTRFMTHGPFRKGNLNPHLTNDCCKGCARDVQPAQAMERILKNSHGLQSVNLLFECHEESPPPELQADWIVFSWTKCVTKSSENGSEIDLPLPLA